MTTNTPWTPGPWVIRGYRSYGDVAAYQLTSPTKIHVASAHASPPTGDNEEAKANAQLIALAPEMAEALQEAETAFAALLYAQAVHPRAVLNRPDCIAATDLCDKALTQARAILARLPQKGGEK